MHIIENYSRGVTELIGTTDSPAWALPSREASFPGQYGIGTSHGGRGGDIVRSLHVIECSEEIYDAATTASGGSDGFITECGRFGVLPGSEFAKQARNWQACMRRAAKKQNELRATEVARQAEEKQVRIAAAKAKAAAFTGDVAAWLSAPFHPAPDCVVNAKQASGLSWSDFQRVA